MRIAIEHRVLSARALGAIVAAAGTVTLFARVIPGVVIIAIGIAVAFMRFHLVLGRRSETLTRMRSTLRLLSMEYAEAESTLRVGKTFEATLLGVAPILALRFKMSAPPSKAQLYLRDVLLKSQRSFVKMHSGGEDA